MLKLVGPGMLGYRLALPDGLSTLDLDLGRMFWMLGDAAPAEATWSIPADERKVLLSSLAQTIERAASYNLRFHAAVELTAQRRKRVGGNITFDMIGPHIYSLAGPVLMFARSAIDEIAYISARRQGLSQPQADRIELGRKEIEKTKERIPEIRILDESYGDWFREVTDYRNALVHRGSRVLGGYYPREARVTEASDPAHNFMLVPDRESIRRPNRPHQWTYKERSRLEDLIMRTVDGFVRFTSEIGATWGGRIPPGGTIPNEDRPNILVPHPTAAFCFDQNAIYVPVFTKEQKAAFFHQVALNGNTGSELIELFLSEIDDQTDGGPGFRFSLPCGVASWATVPAQMVDVRIVLDPAPNRIALAQHLNVFPIATLRGIKKTAEVALIPKAACPNADRLWLFRRKPQL